MKTKRKVWREYRGITIRHDCFGLYYKAKEHGWVTSWVGNGLIHMEKHKYEM